MPLIRFVAKSPRAGCVDNIIVYSPFMKQGQGRRPDGAIVPVAVPDVQAALGWMMGTGHPFADSNFDFYMLARKSDIESPAPSVQCVSIAEPSVSSRHVTAGQPDVQPIGNPGHFAPPPQAGPPPAAGQQYRSETGYEDISDVGLGRTADSMFGDGDPEGGTYTDIDLQGREMKRGTQAPVQPPRTPGP